MIRKIVWWWKWCRWSLKAIRHNLCIRCGVLRSNAGFGLQCKGCWYHVHEKTKPKVIKAQRYLYEEVLRGATEE